MSVKINAKTKVLAVIGDPIEHSMSPKMHNAAIEALGLNYVYVAFHVSPESLSRAIGGFRALGIEGINVTIPHKINVMKYLDEIDPLALKIGAVNTIKNENGFLIGKNTDGEGALRSLMEHGLKLEDLSVIVIGAGGAARAICFSLLPYVKRLTITKYSHNFSQAIHLASELKKERERDVVVEALSLESNSDVLQKVFKDADLIVNTTPVGMYPHVNRIPIDPSLLSSHHFVFDIVYNPLKTRLLKAAEEKGCKTLGGVEMLVYQGALAFEWWTGKFPDVSIMKRVVIEHLGLDS